MRQSYAALSLSLPKRVAASQSERHLISLLYSDDTKVLLAAVQPLNRVSIASCFCVRTVRSMLSHITSERAASPVSLIYKFLVCVAG